MTAIATRQRHSPSAAIRQDSIASTWTLLAIVLAAMSFHLALCFVNTSFAAIGNAHVVASEALIISIAFLVSYRLVTNTHVILLSGIILYVLALSSIRVAFATEDSIDIKYARDLAIPAVFFLLGLRAKDAKAADLVVGIGALIVLAFALFEYFSVDIFTRMFNVAKYYMARGTMEAKQALQSGDLFISGMRPAGAEGGRNLLPFLGDHRVSSVFLEPVSMGNFGIIVFMWALVRSKIEHRLYLGLMAAAVAIIILADSRFGAVFCALCLIVVMLPEAYGTLSVAVAAPLALLALAVLPGLVTGSYDPQHRYVDNGFIGRFVLSSQMLDSLDVLSWFGLKPPRQPAFDSGYAYIISGVGVMGVAAFWALIFAIKVTSQQFLMCRNLCALYYAVILCISNSPFTIKTASLLWFLMGALWKESGVNELKLRARERHCAVG